MNNNNMNKNNLPIKTYIDLNNSKNIIYEENKYKSGIYRLNSLVSGKSYIGSSKSLKNRFSNYYSLNYLNKTKGSSIICRALLKYGYPKFSLYIMEYCEPGSLLEREQYYINTLNPEYNILKIAGSRLGTIQSEKTKQSISNALKGRVFYADSIIKMKIAAKLRLGDKTSFFSKSHTLATISSISLTKSILVKITDIQTNTIIIFKGNIKAAKYLNIGESTLRRYKQTGKIFKDKYIITNVLSKKKLVKLNWLSGVLKRPRL